MNTVTRQEISQWFRERGYTVSERTIKRYNLPWVNKPFVPKLHPEDEARRCVEGTLKIKDAQRRAQIREAKRIERRAAAKA